MRRLVVDPEDPDRLVLETAAALLRNGGIIGIPTDTLYGLAVDSFNARAVARVFMVKGRDAGGVAADCRDRGQVAARIGAMSEIAERLASLSGRGR